MRQPIGRNPTAGAYTGALPAPRPSGRRPYALRVTTLPCDRFQVGNQCGAAAVFISDTAVPSQIDDHIPGALYGLTPAESRVVARLSTGLGISEIADDLGVQLATVRAQLKQAFAKTDTHRQGELVTLLTRGTNVIDWH